MISALYKNQEFCRVGYYVSNEYVEEELKENPPTPPKFDLILRTILIDEPRLTRWPIIWDQKEEAVVVEDESANDPSEGEDDHEND